MAFFSLKVILNIEDAIVEENQGQFLWEVSEEGSCCKKIAGSDQGQISVNIAELTEFVFGKKQIAGLESVKTLSRICINEAV